jgi:hypothetical protein
MAISKKSKKEIHYILSTTRELLYLELGDSWVRQKIYIDGYMQLVLWLLTKYSV